MNMSCFSSRAERYTLQLRRQIHAQRVLMNEVINAHVICQTHTNGCRNHIHTVGATRSTPSPGYIRCIHAQAHVHGSRKQSVQSHVKSIRELSVRTQRSHTQQATEFESTNRPLAHSQTRIERYQDRDGVLSMCKENKNPQYPHNIRRTTFACLGTHGQPTTFRPDSTNLILNLGHVIPAATHNFRNTYSRRFLSVLSTMRKDETNTQQSRDRDTAVQTSMYVGNADTRRRSAAGGSIENANTMASNTRATIPFGSIKEVAQFRQAMGVVYDTEKEEEIKEYLYRMIDTLGDGLRTSKSDSVLLLKELEEGVQEHCHYTPTLGHYNAMIKFTCVNDDVDGAIHFVNCLKKAGHAPDVNTYSTIITVYAKTADLDTAVEMFLKMEKLNLTPGDQAYNAMFHAYRANDDLEGAMYLLSVMNKRGLKPSPLSKRSLIPMFAHHGKGTAHTAASSMAVDMYNELLSDGHTPDNRCFQAVLRNLLLHGRTDEAQAMFQDGFKYTNTPTPAIYTTASTDTPTDTAVDMASGPSNSNVSAPTGGRVVYSGQTYTMMMEHYISKGNYVKAIEIGNVVPEARVEGQVLRHMLIAYRCTNDVDSMKAIVKRMADARVPHDVFFKAQQLTKTMTMLNTLIDRNTDAARGTTFAPWKVLPQTLRDDATSTTTNERRRLPRRKTNERYAAD